MSSRSPLVGILVLIAVWAGGQVFVGEPALMPVDPVAVVSVPTEPSAPSTTTSTTTMAMATPLSPPVRLPSIQVTDTVPPPTTTTVPPIVWGLAGTTNTTRCTQAEPLLEAHAPDGGWDVIRMSQLMRRESGCCPGVRGGDRTTDTCGHIRTVTYTHRSDVGLLQINGINYDPSRCGSSCVVDSDLWSLMDPVTNIEAAADLCSWWRNAGSSCYRPWS